MSRVVPFVAAVALVLAPTALANVAGTVSGAGTTTAGTTFSILVNGYDDGSADGSMAVHRDDRFVLAQARCIVVADDHAFVVGSVISSSEPVAGDVAFALTDAAVDEFGWGIVPRLSCADWLNPPVMEAVMLSVRLADGGISVDFRSPADRLADLIAEVQTGTTNATSFVAKLQSASASMDAGNLEAVCNKLDAFANEVRAQAGKKLTQAEAEGLLRETTTIKTKSGCP